MSLSPAISVNSPATRRRRISSTASTFAIVVIIGGLPFLTAIRLLRPSSWLNRTPLGLRLIDVGLTTWFLVSLVFILYLSTQTRLEGRLGSLSRLVPSPIAASVEVSVFGVGSLADWTVANPRVGIEQIVDAAQVDVAEREAALGLAPVTGTPVPASLSQPTQDSVAESVFTTSERTVQRGDSYWRIAEELLGDPGRWVEIRELNLGREVEPGLYLTAETVLREGWKIVVPRDGENLSLLGP